MTLRAKLGDILVQRGVIDAATLKLALGAQIRFVGQRLRLGQILVDMRACSGEDVARALSQQLNLPYAELAAADPEVARLLPLELCEENLAFAYAREPGPPEAIRVAFADPADLSAVDAVRFRLGKPIRAAVAPMEAIRGAIDRIFRGVAAPEPPSDLAIEDVLFSEDGGGTLAVEHFEAGDLNLPAFSGGSDAPQIDLGNGAEPSDAAFDDIFTTAPAQSRPLSAFGLIGADEPEIPANRVPVTRFPDKRPREPSPPQPSPPKPTLVLTSSALFGPAPEPNVAEPKSDTEDIEELEPLPELSGEIVEDDAAEVDLPVTVSRDLFGSGFDATHEPDPHQPSVGEGKALFGSAFDAGGLDLGGDGEEPMPELARPAPKGIEMEAEVLDAFDIVSAPSMPAASPAAAPPTASVSAAASDDPLAAILGRPPTPMATRAAVVAATTPTPPAPEPVSAKVQLSALLTPPKIPAAKPEAPKPAPEPQKAAAMPAPSSEASPGRRTPPPSVTPVADPARVRTPLAGTAIAAEAAKAPLPPAAKPEPVRPSTPAASEARPAAAPSVDPFRPTTPLPFTAVALPEPAAAKSPPPAAPAPAAQKGDEPESLASFADRPLTPDELKVIESIERLADGAPEEAQVKQVKPAQMIAALVRLLIRRGIVQETEFLAELERK